MLFSNDYQTIQGSSQGEYREKGSLFIGYAFRVENESDILRVHLKKGMANLHEDCDIMVDQIRAIDNKRLIKKVGILPTDLVEKVKGNITILLDLE